ncbi:MAG: tRNA lysidine(34) synthetase TilS [Rhodobacteraceae bacterium]|nr:tRNA lysidine(34) synthetase TilS [Paracoccaceae bacterium]
MSPPDAKLAEAMARLLPALPPARLGVAVSGGGDSMALMMLLADWARAQGVVLEAVSVDHGLRAESATEAAAAGALAARLGLAHAVRRWERGPAPGGNLMDAARRARRTLIADWALARGIGAVALGHTLDDQAETLLMRLARGSGVDGLAGMAEAHRRGGVLWLRPLLGVRRDVLRSVLRDRGLGWAEDPTNADTRFLRTRARAALVALAPLGIGAERLAGTAAAMTQAQAALERTAQATGLMLLRMERGDAVLDARALDALPDDLRERIVARVLCALSSQPYRPRRAALRRALAEPQRATLHGCVLSRAGDRLRIGREWRAVAGLRAAPGAPWDNRWVLTPAPGTDAQGCTIAALGPQGLAQIGAWAACGLPRASVLASPAVWRGDTVLAAPLVRGGSQWRAHARQGPADLLRGPLSH